MSAPEFSSCESAELSEGILGTGLSDVGDSSGVSGLPPVNWMKATPVNPSRPSLARVSIFTGVSDSTRMRATTLRGSRGSSRSAETSPTWMPLYCTAPPFDSPVTDSVNTMS